MATNDFTYRLKAQSGQSTPVDELGGSTLTGSTQTLIDRGSGDYAWRFAVGQALATLPTKAINGTTGNGCTLVLKGRIKNYGTLDYNVEVAFGATTPGANDTSGSIASSTFAICCVGAGNTQFVQGSNNLYTPSRATTVDTEFTMVLCVKENGGASGFDVLQIFYNGGSGSTPDQTSTLANWGTFNITNLTLNASNGTILEFSDIVFYPNEKTGTEARALATDLRTTLDSAGATAPGASITATSSFTGGAASASTPGTGPGANITATSSFTGGAASATNYGTLTIIDVKNNTGYLRVSELFNVFVYNRTTGALVVSFLSQTTTAGGDLVVTSASIVAGTVYRVVLVDSSDEAGVGKVTAT